MIKVVVDRQYKIIGIRINKIFINQGTWCDYTGNSTVMHEPARLYLVARVIGKFFSYGYIAIAIEDQGFEESFQLKEWEASLQGVSERSYSDRTQENGECKLRYHWDGAGISLLLCYLEVQ
ncbi:hypothetical protein RRF57_010149 [Xylaria bambusicola]|uniref:Uncharacterized protein n=1 Tax=Xylaria bambusicola TaxID=326684 RepID=A0AAN7UXU4_9PEZI